MNRRRSGFTLIELLVVIAIIAILAAILFPVLISAQESGRAAACIGNMRQIGAAVTMYVDDSGGRFPPWISYLNGRASGNQVNMMGYMRKYLISEKLWVCPSQKNSMYSYWMNAYLNYWHNAIWIDTGLVPPIASSVRYAKLTVFMCEGPGVTRAIAQQLLRQAGITKAQDDIVPSEVPIWNWGANPSHPLVQGAYGTGDTRHNGLGNYIFCDGHIKALAPDACKSTRKDALTDPLIIGNPSCDGMNPSFRP